MVSAVCGEWVANLETMTCWNSCWDITVVFEKHGKAMVGKINYLPDNLLKYWARDKKGHEI
jgi:hypothetical protein